MNNQDLMYFCSLIDTGSYTKTAAFFQVTQPTISAAIRRLSKHFKDPLVVQSNRKSKLKNYCGWCTFISKIQASTPGNTQY